MVVFVCFSCGESLKKNQVEKHWMTRCRHTQRVSCMDCSKDFWGKDYAEHVKCITENEKYGGSHYVGKEMKGEKKQEAWIAQIKEVVANTHDMKPKLKELLNYITTFSNIPRKKEKFKNFLINSAKVHDPSLTDEAWEVFQAANAKNNNNNKSNGEMQNDGSKAASKPPDATAQEDDDNQKPNLSKRARKEERQKKNKKKEKKDKSVKTSTELTKPSKRKCEEDESDAEGKDSQRKRKKPKHEGKEMECGEQNDKKSKKKKKRAHEDQNGALVMNENQADNMNGEAHNEPEVDVAKQAEEGKSKKKKKSPKDQNEKHLENMNGEDRDGPEIDIAQQPEEGESKKKKKKKLIPKNENGVLEANENHSQDLKNGEDAEQVSSAFKWKAAIRKVLQDAPEEGMKIGRLQKKVHSLYCAAKGESAYLKSAKELNATISKKLKMNDNKFIVCKNRVKLRSQ